MQIETSANLNTVEGASSGGTQVGQSALDLVGFYGAVPVVQQTTATNVHTVAAGSTTAVFTTTTFDGSIGSTAYTVGDLVAVLKSVGLIKS